MSDVNEILRDPFFNTIILMVLIVLTVVTYSFSPSKVNNVRSAVLIRLTVLTTFCYEFRKGPNYLMFLLV